MLIDLITTDFEFEDERGSLKQLVRRGYSQINVITSNAGVFRGGHYHKMNTESFYVVKGNCKVTARMDGIEETKVFREGDFFRIGPYVTHDFEYIEDTILVTMYSLGIEMDDGSKDSFEEGK